MELGSMESELVMILDDHDVINAFLGTQYTESSYNLFSFLPLSVASWCSRSLSRFTQSPSFYVL